MPNEPIGQHALTVIAPVRAEVAETLAATLAGHQKGVIDVLLRVRTLHFARWVILSGPRLAFESNHDGPLDAHLDELLREIRAAGLEQDLFGGWEGYEAGGLAAFCAKHARPAQAFYLGHPGLSVGRVQKDRDLHAALEGAADAIDRSARSAVEIRRALLRAVEGGGFDIEHVDRGLPPDAAQVVFWATLFLVVLPVALLLAPIAILTEAYEASTEPRMTPPDEVLLDEIARLEDARALNGLTHHVPLRTSVFRKVTTRAVLGFVEVARRFLCYKGDLTGIATIHFARWVILDDDTVLFFSNYDGSWESYLGDFVDKAARWLTAVWMGARHFPRTHLYIFGGAARESEFKEWTRRWQVKNQIWYSAYPDTSVSEVLRNARIREGAVGEATEEEAKAWLSLV